MIINDYDGFGGQSSMKLFRGTQEANVSARETGADQIGYRPFTERAGVKVEFLGTACLLRVCAEIDIFNSPALDATIAYAARVHGGDIVVSFVDCRFADCSCLRVLIRQYKLLGVRLSIVAPLASALGRILDVTSLTTMLPVHRTLREACPAISIDRHALYGASRGRRSTRTDGNGSRADQEILYPSYKS